MEQGQFMWLRPTSRILVMRCRNPAITVTTRIPLQGMPPTATFPEVGETATGMDAGNGESTANMSTANMSGASMSGASMRGANMSGVNAADGSLRRQGVSARPTCRLRASPIQPNRKSVLVESRRLVLWKDSPLPDTEIKRLALLDRYQLLDMPEDAAFDRITELAARMLQAPIAVVSFGRP